MITGQTGSGKSYMANALAISALRQFKTVKYCKASQLIDELNRAEALDTYREALAHLVSFDLLVIDDFGLMQLDLNKCRNLFEVLESRDPGQVHHGGVPVPGESLVRPVSGTHLCRRLSKSTIEQLLPAGNERQKYAKSHAD